MGVKKKAERNMHNDPLGIEFKEKEVGSKEVRNLLHLSKEEMKMRF